MKLYSVLNNIILEAVNKLEVEDAIEKHQTIRLWYEGDETIVKGWRWVEPYVLGLSKKGNPIVRVFQIKGVTDTEQPQWKTFRLDKITYWQKIPKFFLEPISDKNKSVAKYNDKGDGSMTKIFKQIQFKDE
jgi:hypothetical protein